MSNVNQKAALRYRRREWMPVPVYPRQKNPIGDGWTELRLTEADVPQHFSDGQNVGILLGEPSGGLVDIDLDCEEALVLAEAFLPPTDSVFGRKSTPASHWLYMADPLPDTEKFQFIDDVEGKRITTMLVEFRSTGGQTVFPPSTHPSGESIAWEHNGEPAIVDGHSLRSQVAQLAAAALLVRHWPNVNGSRQDIALALAGGLLRGGWDEEEVAEFIGIVAETAGDEETAKRAKAAEFTARSLAQDRPTTGWPTLAELIGERVVERVCQWLGMQRERSNGQSAKAEARHKERPMWLTAREFVSQQPEDVQWLWDGYIAPGNVTLLASRPKCGKTTLEFHLLAAISNGRDFLGRSTRRAKVLLLSEEPNNLIRRRLANLGLESDDLLIAKRSDIPNWDDALGVAQDAIRSQGVRLVSVDTLGSFWGIDQENEAGKVLAALQPLVDLAQREGVAVLLLHHLRKSPGSEGTASRGSSALVGASDIIVEIHRDEHVERRRKLVAFSRYDETPREVLIELGDAGYRLLGTPKDVTKNTVRVRVLDALPGAPSGITQDDIHGGMNPPVAKGMLSGVLKELREEEIVERSGRGRKGDPYRYWRAEGQDDDFVELSESEDVASEQTHLKRFVATAEKLREQTGEAPTIDQVRATMDEDGEGDCGDGDGAPGDS